MEQAQYELEKKGMRPPEGAEGEAFELDEDDEMVQAVMNHGIAAMWKMGRIDVRNSFLLEFSEIFW
jgi:hypothetical protein